MRSVLGVLVGAVRTPARPPGSIDSTGIAASWAGIGQLWRRSQTTLAYEDILASSGQPGGDSSQPVTAIFLHGLLGSSRNL